MTPEAQTEPRREPLAGLVERVTFHSPDSGFCVLRVLVRGHREPVTVIGSVAAIQAGEQVQASGTWENNRYAASRIMPRRAIGVAGRWLYDWIYSFNLSA